MSLDYRVRKGTQKKREGKGTRQGGLFRNGSQGTTATETMNIITGTRHHNMFNCLNNIRACGTLVGGGDTTFVQWLIETGTVEAESRYNGDIRGGEEMEI